MPDHPYRLPRHVVPSHYRIRLEPDLDAATFAGSEIVTIDVTESTSRIVLNTAELVIHKAHLRNETQDHGEASVDHDEDAQRAILTFNEEIRPGSWELSCDFTGILNDQLHGFYRSTFTDVEGNEQVIATTQFEATDARRAFPCWDEPDFKATFGVTLVVPDELMAVSNGAEVERTPLEDGKVAVRFADTIKMSTYLVAFVVGQFEATEPLDVDGVPLRIIAPKGKKHLTHFAMKCGEFCLGYLADYYDIPYPGDKMDMVAIPDFAFGAMENLGCITYRESALLVDEATATSGELSRILDVVAHELAHMWFGDLVTMKWWNGIWLNEAFATFMEMKATDSHRPDWKRWLSFGAVERAWALKVDDLASTRPVEFEVNSPEDATAMFDALTYGKGSAVLRMIEQYLGEEPFRLGVANYLGTHAYGNTETADLWKDFDEASGQPVGDIMDTWILQGGYPLVEVTPAVGGVTISQRRFLMTPDPADQTIWKLPLQIRGMAAGKPFSTKLLLDRQSTTLAVDDPIEWIIANAGGHGFYRTWYDDSLFATLMDGVGSLEALERYTLVDDAWAFVESGQARAASFLAVASAFENETEHAIWTAILAGAAGIGHHLVSEPDRPQYEKWVTELVASQADRLGWETKEGEPDLTRRLRGQLFGAMGRMANDPTTIDQSHGVYEQLISDPTGVDPEVGQAALFTVAAHGDAQTYEEFLNRHKDAATPQESLKYLQALATFDDKTAVDRAFELIVDGTIRSQDASWVLARLLMNRISGPYAWTGLRRLWSGLADSIPSMTHSRMVEGLPALSRPDVAADVEAFFAETPLPHAAKALEQKLERMRAMVAMREREAQGISEAFNA